MTSTLLVKTKDCLTLEEFDEWATTGELSPSRRSHLNDCTMCQAMAEQIHGFDPAVATSRLLAPLSSALSNSAKRILGAAVLAGISMLALGGLAWSEARRGHAQAVAFENRRADAAERRSAMLATTLAAIQAQAPKMETITATLERETTGPHREAIKQLGSIAKKTAELAQGSSKNGPVTVLDEAAGNVMWSVGDERFSVRRRGEVADLKPVSRALKKKTLSEGPDAVGVILMKHGVDPSTIEDVGMVMAGAGRSPFCVFPETQ